MRRSPTLTLLAVVVLIAVACAPPPAAAPTRAERWLATLDRAGRVAQTLAVSLTGMDTSAVADAVRAVRVQGVGAVVVGSGASREVAGVVAVLRAASPLPLLVAAELDQGVGGLVGGATELPPLRALTLLRTPAELGDAGGRVGREAALLDLDLALVRLPPLQGSEPAPWLARSPERTAEGVATFVRGAREAGLEVGVDALWAEGSGAPLLAWDRARLEALELRTLRASLEAGAAAVRVGAVRLPSLTGDTVPLPHSPAALEGVLRRQLGSTALVAADVGPAAPLARRYGSEEAGVRALAAGADLLLGVRDPQRMQAAILAAIREGRLAPARVDAAARRVLEFKARRAEERRPPPPPDSVPARLVREADPELAARLAAESTHRLLGPAALERALAVPDSTILLVRPLGRGQWFASRFAERRPGVRQLVLNLSADSAALAARLAEEAAGARTLVLVSFPADVGPDLRSLLSATDSARAVAVVLGAPPAAGRLPSPAVFGWSEARAGQEVAARVLFGDEPGAPLAEAVHWPPAPALRPMEPESVGMSARGLAEVDRVIERAIADSVFPGAALVIGRRAGLVRLRGYGHVEVGGAPVDPRTTLYDIASLTKVVGTTTAIAALVEAEQLQLDDPVRRYLPDYEGDGRERITIRHLLTHTSGLPAGLWLYGSARSPEQALRAVLRQPPKWEPGERMEYSDLGMILLAAVAEAAAETSLDRYLAARVFAPLGMQRTMFLPPLALAEHAVPTARESQRPFVLRGVVHDANAFRLGGIAGHSGLFSTAADLARFAQMMLNGGSYSTARVLSGATVQRFTTRQPGAEPRALGWDTPSPRSSAGRFFSGRSFGHTGYTGTSIWIDPETDLFVVLLTNRTLHAAPARDMMRVRAAVHDAAARAVEGPAAPRPGSRRIR